MAKATKRQMIEREEDIQAVGAASRGSGEGDQDIVPAGPLQVHRE